MEIFAVTLEFHVSSIAPHNLWYPSPQKNLTLELQKTKLNPVHAMG